MHTLRQRRERLRRHLLERSCCAQPYAYLGAAFVVVDYLAPVRKTWRRLEKQRSCCGYHNTVISYTLLAFTLGLTIMVFAWREGCPSHLSPSR